MNPRFALLLFPLSPTWALAQGTSLDKAAGHMTVADGFSVKLIAGEPDIRQPILVKFDDRGRLWVIQYLQYPNPAGLKRVRVDRYSRTVYDRIPKPPPHGPRGADRITILEDTNGDGRADRFKDFVDGLNLSTGLAFGHGGVFVLQVPYLLFYPDRNRDDVPDSDPVVCLEGFGMEDSQAFANHLTWGPDGWLYGLNGSTTTCRIRGIEFQQGVWRYHPVTQEFELFCEGGGNIYGLTFNAEGQLFYSSNGARPSWHGVQGAYYHKAFAKHGELHNPYTYGYFQFVPHENYRGGHVTCGGNFYYGDSFPAPFRGTYIANNLLSHEIHWHRFFPLGSTFRSRREGELVVSNDTWCAPVDLTVGPDGAVTFCDFHDQRTAHPDPDAVWDKSNGRVYRIQAKGAKIRPHVDLNELSSNELIPWLGESNYWYVRRARRILAQRRDPEVIPRLRELALQTDDDHLALEALWALYVSGGFDDAVAQRLLAHRSEAVRSWTVRLLGDAKDVSPDRQAQLVALARSEPSPVVRSQLAASSKRLPGEKALSIVWELLLHEEDRQDPYIPLLLWWAVESKADSDREEVLQRITSTKAWEAPMIREEIIGRLARRYAAVGNPVSLAAAAQLAASAPHQDQQVRMLVELDNGLKGRLGDSVPITLRRTIAEIVSPKTSTDSRLLRLMFRCGIDEAHERIVQLAIDSQVPTATRVAMLGLLGQLGKPSCASRILPLLHDDQQPGVEGAVLKALGRFDEEAISAKILLEYPRFSDGLKGLSRQVLFSRPNWTLAFLQEIDAGRFNPKLVDVEELRGLDLLEDEPITELVTKYWGRVTRGTPEEKLADIRRYTNDLRAFSGHARAGYEVFTQLCAKCHKLFGEGEEIGPDLTAANRKDQQYLLASIVDPSHFIRAEYLNLQVITDDGRSFAGLVIKETPTTITLINSNNETILIDRDNIDEMGISEISQMPESLLRPLSPQQLRDLFAYLRSDELVKQYTVYRTRTPIQLDGKLDDPAWQSVPDMGPFHFPWWKQGKKMRSTAKMLWDDKYLYFGHVCEDEHITARYKNHNVSVAKDDCFEVMIAPNPEKPEVYFNVEWNVLGAYIDGHRLHGPKKPSVPWDTQGIRIAGSYEGTLNEDGDTDRSWACEMVIPFANFTKYLKHVPPLPGDSWNLNLNRHGGDTNMQYSQWSPSDASTPSFHTPHRFGTIVFSAQEGPIGQSTGKNPRHADIR